MGDGRSTITIDLAAVRANVARLRAPLGDGALWAVVKAEGYGHGALVVGRAAVEAGATGLAVATLAEARSLRAALPDVRIMVMSPLAPGEEGEATGFEVVVSTPDGRKRALDRPDLAVHVKVETGLGRWGLSPSEALDLGRRLVEDSAGPRLVGLMTHLATSEEADTTFAERQVERFRAMSATFPPCMRHVANSGGLLRLRDVAFDGARAGIALYGLAPDDVPPDRDGLAPALRWTSRVAAVRELERGDSAGYGRRLVARESTRVAVVPVGYADGYPRPASGRAAVLIGGVRCQVDATVAMDAMMVTLPSSLRVQVGDEVTLIGRDGEGRIGLEELARAAGTIGYEVACGLRDRPDRGRRVTEDRAG